MAHGKEPDSLRDQSTSSPNNSTALMRTNRRRTIQFLWKPWMWYESWHPFWRITVPFASAFAALTAGWQVLEHGEYAVAIGSAVVFLVLSLLAVRELQIPKAWKVIIGTVLVIVGIYSASVFLVKKGDHPWTSLWPQRKSADAPPVPMPQPAPFASPTPTARATPFSVAIEGGFWWIERNMVDTHWWVTYRSPYGHTASPVHVAMFLRLINLQPKPAVIVSYTVEVRNKENIWMELPHIRLQGAELFDVKDGDFRRARLLSVDSLNASLVGKAIEPHKPARGWAFFELPEDRTPNTQFRITVKDAEGTQSTQLMDSSGGDRFPVQTGSIYVTGRKRDISQYHRRYYNDFIK